MAKELDGDPVFNEQFEWDGVDLDTVIPITIDPRLWLELNDCRIELSKLRDKAVTWTEFLQFLYIRYLINDCRFQAEDFPKWLRNRAPELMPEPRLVMVAPPKPPERRSE